jgi:signal transduction histidine kinase/CheY-like chemotaxis protein/HPt (histidine-containing phosphotransfer) domain-containing protein
MPHTEPALDRRDHPSDPTRRAPHSRIPQAAGFFAIVIALAVLTGWQFDIELLKRAGPLPIPMNPVTAICFLLAGSALVLTQFESDAASGKALRRLMGAAIMAIGGAKIVDTFGDLDLKFGVDTLLYPDRVSLAGTSVHYLMAIGTAIAFVIVGMTLVLHSIPSLVLRSLKQALVLALMGFTAAANVSYAYGILGLLNVQIYNPMAVHTAVTFLVVGIGLLWLDSDSGVAAIISNRNIAGSTARLLLPGVIGIPLFMGLVWLKGIEHRWFDVTTGASVFVIGIITVLAAVATWVIARLDREAVKLAARTAALVEASKAADAANEAKSSFLKNMSHELRTPMNGVLGMIDILDRSRLSPDQRQMVGTVRQSARALLDVVDDILDFSRIEDGRTKTAAVPSDVTQIVEGTARLFLGAAETKGLRMRCCVAPEISGKQSIDPVLLRQVLGNLCSNAVKFTEEGEITITADRADIEGRHSIVFTVQDTGIGMSSETQSRLFQPFSQADGSTARRFDGAGLGLSICSRLVRLMHGEIHIRSAPGAGSTFTVTIPIEGDEPEQVPDRARLAGISVALVALDGVEASYIARYLRFRGATVDNVSADELTTQGQVPRFDLLLGPWDLAEELETALSSPAFGASRPRIVLLTHQDESRDRILSQLEAIVTTALSRARIEAAVASAVGRAMPNADALQQTQEGADADVPVSRDEAKRTGRLILMAEDHPVNRDIVARQLEYLGYAADVVSNGAEALNALQQTAYGLLITDCNMPGMDGFELTATIRRHEPAGKHLPIIALTANKLSGEAERCLAAGMDDYISKPASIATLRTRLERWLPNSKDVKSAPAGMPTPTPPPEEPPSIANGILDLSIVQEFCGDDTEIINDNLRAFVQSLDEDLAALADAIATDDGELAKITAHRIKGAARMVGATRLADCCDAIERAAGSRDWSEVVAKMPDLGIEASIVRQEIARLTGAVGQPAWTGSVSSPVLDPASS